MKLYKYEQVEREFRYRRVRTVYGVIEAKEIDEFNVSVNVFQPLVEHSQDVALSEYWKDEEISGFAMMDDQSFSHTNELDLSEASKKELKRVLAYLEHINVRVDERASRLKSLRIHLSTELKK